MSLYTVQVVVMPLKELLDPQGKAVNDTLHKLGHTAIKDIRIGKHITLQIDATTSEEALQKADVVAKDLLHNPVMEFYSASII